MTVATAIAAIPVLLATLAPQGASIEPTVTAYRNVADSVVLVICPSRSPDATDSSTDYASSGSAFFIEDDLLVTNYHVISEALEIEVYFHDGRGTRVSVVGTAPSYDLALLALPIDAPRGRPAPLAGGTELMIGQTILAIGSPFGLGNSVTSGIVSGLHRELPGTRYGPNIIQFDAAVNPGQSGGPLVDKEGNVVGIVTAKVDVGEAVGFAVPIRAALDMVPDLLAMGHPFRAQLGLQVTEVNSELSSLFGLSVERGLLVETVEEGSAAAKAGLIGGNRFVFLRDRVFSVGGDIIVAVDRHRFSEGEDAALLIYAKRPGEELHLELVAPDGRTREVVLIVPPMEH